MRWRGRRASANIEDRRGRRPMRMAAGGGGLGLVIILVIGLLMGADPAQLLSMLGGAGGGMPGAGQVSTAPPSAADEERAQFVAVVLADTEDVWNRQFAQMGEQYREPTLVMFDGAVQSACGFAQSAMGPFYCPGDSKVYLDLSFFDDLRARHGAPGDFAQAYVIAHEVGHHIQNLLGISDQVQAARGRLSETEYNKLSVRLELQADFLAGVWAHHAQRMANVLEPGDIEEALGAASAIGDDRLQREARGYVVPDAFTHGTSAQRVRWFRRGFESGDFHQGDTFAADEL